MDGNGGGSAPSPALEAAQSGPRAASWRIRIAAAMCASFVVAVMASEETVQESARRMGMTVFRVPVRTQQPSATQWPPDAEKASSTATPPLTSTRPPTSDTPKRAQYPNRKGFYPAPPSLQLSRGRTPRTYPEYSGELDQPPSTCVPRAAQLYDDPRFGFVFGAFNHYASPNRGWGAVAAIESLVKIGGWGGRVYLVTTRKPPGTPSCFSQSYIRKLTGNNNVYVTDALPHGSSGGGFAKADMALLVEAIHNADEATGPAPEVLIWHDVDHLWARTGCVEAETMRDPLRFGPNATMFWHPIRYNPTNPNDGRGNHVGTFQAHRKWSRYTLKRWRQEIEKTPNTQDYNPLMRAWVSDPGRIRPGVSPPAWRDNMWDFNKIRCHNHLTYRGRCMANTVRKSQPFIASLCLDTLGGNGADVLDIIYCGTWGVLNPENSKDIVRRWKEISEAWCRRVGNVNGSVV